MHADFSRLEIDLRAYALHDPDFQVENAAIGERRDEGTVLRVKLDQPVTRRDVHNAVVASTVGPVRHAAARQLARRDRRTLSLAQTVSPVELSSRGVERHDRSALAAGRIKVAADHDRRAFELVFGAWPEIVGFEAPRHAQRVEVRRVDLIERRIARAVIVCRVVRPVAAGRARLCRWR
jgi:hypothetical protein